MKLSQLRSFLEQMLELENFRKNIDKEVTDYKKQLSKKGVSSEVLLEADTDLYLTKVHLSELCNHYLRLNRRAWDISSVLKPKKDEKQKN